MSYRIKDAEGKPLVKNGVEVVGFDSVSIIKGVDTEKRTMSMIGSTEDPDRDGDIIMVNGWNLKNYLKNPVILWGHEYHQAPIGAATKVIKKRSPARLEFNIKFPTLGINPFADMILELFNEKIMNASSVGFMPSEWEKIDEEDQSYWSPRKYLKQELLELSMVSVPANPHAVQNAMNFVKNLDNGTQLVDVLLGRENLIPVEDAIAEIEEIKAKGAEYEEEEKTVAVQVPEDITNEEDDLGAFTLDMSALDDSEIKVLSEDEYDSIIRRIDELENLIQEMSKAVTSVPRAPQEDPPEANDTLGVILTRASKVLNAPNKTAKDPARVVKLMGIMENLKQVIAELK